MRRIALACLLALSMTTIAIAYPSADNPQSYLPRDLNGTEIQYDSEGNVLLVDADVLSVEEELLPGNELMIEMNVAQRITNSILMGDGRGDGLGFVRFTDEPTVNGPEDLMLTETKRFHWEFYDEADDPSTSSHTFNYFALERAGIYAGFNDEVPEPQGWGPIDGRVFLAFTGQAAAADHPGDNLERTDPEQGNIYRTDSFFGIAGSADISYLNIVVDSASPEEGPFGRGAVSAVSGSVPTFGVLVGVAGGANYRDSFDAPSVVTLGFGNVPLMIGVDGVARPLQRAIDDGVETNSILGTTEIAIGVNGWIDAGALAPSTGSTEWIAESGYDVERAMGGQFYVTANSTSVNASSFIERAYGIYVGDSTTASTVSGTGENTENIGDAISGEYIDYAVGVFIEANNVPNATQDWSMVAEGDVAIGGTTYLDDTVVLGETDFLNDVGIATGNSLTLGSGSAILSQTGTVTIDANTQILGSVSSSGSISGTNLAITGSITDSNSDVTINDGLSVSGNAYFTGSVTVGDEQELALGPGASIWQGDGPVLIDDSAQILGALDVYGNVNVTGMLYDSNSDVTIADGLVPDTDGTRDLGSSTYAWDELFAQSIKNPNGNTKLESISGADIVLDSADEIFLDLGDASGSDEFKIRDSSGSTVVAAVDSDGNAGFAGGIALGTSNEPSVNVLQIPVGSVPSGNPPGNTIWLYGVNTQYGGNDAVAIIMESEQGNTATLGTVVLMEE